METVKDLFSLNSIPPLRKRRDDIQVLLKMFLDRNKKLLRKDIKGIEKDCMSLLMNDNWPGNVRQLESVVEQMTNISRGKYLRYIDLPDYIVTECLLQKYGNDIADEPLSPHSMEYGKIIQLLKQEHGHVKTVASLMNIPLSTFYRKCNKYKIDPNQYREW